MNFKNMAKMGWYAVCANIWHKRTPLNVMLAVTDRCHSNCVYCNIPNRAKDELTTLQIFNLIDQISKMGCQRIGLWGGEPLVRDDIGQIINYARSKGLFVTLDSNGYLVPKKIDRLAGLNHLVLAFDGDEKAHDLNRGRGSFEKLMAAIEAVSGKVPFWTITVLTKNNLDSIDFILAQARKYKFLTTFQLLHHNDKLAANQKNLIPSAQDYRKVIKKLIFEKKNGAPIVSSVRYLNHILNWEDYHTAVSSQKKSGFKCWAGELYCNVDTDGGVYPCSLLVDKIPALNFIDVTFKEAFTSLNRGNCQDCIASCFSEYNYLYSLDPATIMDWVNSMRKTRKYLGLKKWR